MGAGEAAVGSGEPPALAGPIAVLGPGGECAWCDGDSPASPRVSGPAKVASDELETIAAAEAALAPPGSGAGAGGALVLSPGLLHPATGSKHSGDITGAALSASGRSGVCAVAIHELNEEAIELIFTFLPAEDRRSAAAVCRLWRRVHNSSTKLWGSVLLSGERIVQAAASSSAGAIVSWVAARLEAMRSVRLWSPYPLEAFASGLAQLLSRENRLQSFSYVCPDASVSRLLGELQGLTSLQLLDILSPAIAPGQGLVVRARELAKLKPLRNLLSLKLAASEIQGVLPPALFRRLNRLQHLAISAKCCLPAAVVRQLTGLQSLELHGANMDEAAAEAAAALQQLTRLGISVSSWPQQAQQGQARSGDSQQQQGQQQQGQQQQGHGGVAASGAGTSGGGSACGTGGAAAPLRWQDHPIWGQLPLLARLQQLTVGAELPMTGPAAAVGQEGEDGGDASSAGGGPAAILLPFDVLDGSVPDGIMDCSSLTHLALPVALTSLPDLLPGQLPRLVELDLTHSITEALPPSWCCHLQSLCRLVLNGAQLAGSSLPPEFSKLQSLRQLEMRACRLQVLPACVARLSGLTHLDLGLNRLTELPGGPYLSSLRQLGLRSNALAALPPVLAGAAALEVLDVGESEGLVLHAADVDGILAAMPNLRHLVLSRQPAGLGFGPYMSASTGAAWDVQSVGVLMRLARALPCLAVHLERPELIGVQPPPPHHAAGGSSPI